MGKHTLNTLARHKGLEWAGASESVHGIPNVWSAPQQVGACVGECLHGLKTPRVHTLV